MVLLAKRPIAIREANPDPKRLQYLPHPGLARGIIRADTEMGIHRMVIDPATNTIMM